MWILIAIASCDVWPDDRSLCLDWHDGDACMRIAPTDTIHEERLYGLACTFGNLEGCAIRVRSFRRDGVFLGGEEGDQAKPRMTAACDADLPAGCRELGYLVSGQAARDAFGKACKLGDSEACAVLGARDAEGR